MRVTIDFEHRAGDLELTLYRGGEVVDRAHSTRDSESADTTYDGVEPLYARIYGHEQATGPYTITVTIEGGVDLGDPCDDRNEIMEDAFELDAGVYNGLAICDGDVDWFRIHATVGAGTISIDFNGSAGNLDIELYRSNGELIATGVGDGNHESVESGVGVRYLKVFGRSGATGSYTLNILED